MPDICMCRGEGCPLKDSCHRHTARPDQWQSWFTEIPYDEKTKAWQYYWQVDHCDENPNETDD